MKIDRITSREHNYVNEVLQTQFSGSRSVNMTKRLEAAFAEKFGCRYAISFANGTATMHAALAAAGVGPGDEVIVPPLTMASTSFAVLQAGAVPVFADIDARTWVLDPKSVASRITERTKAILPVALYGLSPDMDPIMELAAKYKLFVLEDDAECFLGTYKGRLVGTLGHAASFSFQSSKHMATGEGGMMITNDEELALKMRRLGSLGYAALGAAAGQSKISKDVIQNPGYLRHICMGWNYRISELCAAVALGQLEHLEELVQVRVDSGTALTEAVAGCNWLQPQHVPADCGHAYWTFVCLLREDAPCTWQEFRSKFLELGGDPFYSAWALTYHEPAFYEWPDAEKLGWKDTQGLCPVAEKIQPRLMQFKTNYFDTDRRDRAAAALRKTVAFWGK